MGLIGKWIRILVKRLADKICNELNKCSLIFRIYDIENHTVESSYQVKTTINAFGFPNDDNGGEARVNLTNEFAPLKKAFNKGLKMIENGVIDSL